jgi:sentrin-specific protease 7
MNDSDIHFFTSHFYTTLLNEGEDAVMSWTSKKNINVFQKKFIFIPINKDLHWSLCVIVNPGHIMHAFEDDEEKKSELPLPGLIFLDSLSLHRKPTIRSKLQKWLNAEWTRLHGEPEQPSPFNKKTFRLFSPRGKFATIMSQDPRLHSFVLL